MIFFTILFYAVLTVILVGFPLWLADKKIINSYVGLPISFLMLVISFIIVIVNLIVCSDYFLNNNKCNVETTEIALYQMADYGDDIYVVATIGDEITYLVRCDTDNGPQYTEFDSKRTSIVEDNCANPYITYTHKWFDFPLNIIFPINEYYTSNIYEIHISMDKIKTLYYTRT